MTQKKLSPKELKKAKDHFTANLTLTYYEFVALVAMTRGMVTSAAERENTTESDQFCLLTLLSLSSKIEDKLEEVLNELGEA